MAVAGASAVAAWIAAGTAVAGTIYQVKTASDNADAASKAQEEANRAQAEAAISNYGELSSIERDALLEEGEQNMAVQKDYLAAKGRVNTMAAATGTGGLSVGAQMESLDRQLYSNFDAVQATRQSKLDNVQNQARSIQSQATGNMDYTPINRPSWAAGALQIGGSIAGAYGKLDKDLTAIDQAKQVNQQKAGG
ncbi:hypothetical protein [Pseudomonas phage Njord]|uniref:Internal virion protein n=1 Tax=Pseudomonas phage Njord TaxID=2163985 RepID=A0A2S1GML6_9CAUD|nr:internal virion protein [Pseudomonas phage Njord]AWD90620.1 hypothetical protein [Pseudomonas phage Njord]